MSTGYGFYSWYSFSPFLDCCLATPLHLILTLLILKFTWVFITECYYSVSIFYRTAVLRFALVRLLFTYHGEE
ncbi:hypothetical protein V8F33_003995 [Rhypophila sp. PSN 637]